MSQGHQDDEESSGVMDDGPGSSTPDEPPARATSGLRSLLAHRRLVAAVLVLLVVASTLGVIAVLRDDGTPHPAAWDSRVKPFADFVEKERGLQFDHPVFVDLLTTKEFLEQSQPFDIDRGGSDRTTIDRMVRLLRALGVVGGALDLYNSTDQLRGTSVVGYYSYVDERIRIRGTDFTPAVQSTLIHELTHALRDQQVDLDARLDDLGRDPAKQAAYRALLEGDADQVQAAWREALDADARRELDDDIARQEPSDSGGTTRVPPIVKSFAAAPTLLGKTLLTVVLQDGRREALDDLFLKPPTTQEQLLDPWTLVQDHQGYLAIDVPGVSPGDQTFDEGTFGALSWLLVLAERLSPSEALTAAKGWGGDAFVAYSRDGTDCLTISYAADSAQDREEMRTALADWIRRGPRNAARVTRQGQQLLFEACATDESDLPEGSNQTREALALAILHTDVSIDLVRSGYDSDVARCGADALIERYTGEALKALLLRKGQVHRVLRPCLPAGSD